MRKLATLTRTTSINPGIEVHEIDVGRCQTLRLHDPVSGYSLILDVIEAAELQGHIGAWLEGSYIDRGDDASEEGA